MDTTEEIEALSRAVNEHLKTNGLMETTMADLKLFKATEPTERETVVYDPSLCVVVQGGKEIVVGEQAYHYNPAHSLIVSVDMPASTRVSQATPENPCVALVISLRARTVAELLAEGTTVGSSSGPPSIAVGVTPTGPKLLRAILRLVELLEAPEDANVLAPLILKEIHYRLLIGPQGERLRQIAIPGAPAQRIAEVISWLKEHFAETVKVERLAERAGLSTSAFHQHFKSITNLSPLQYQKRFRLQEARRRMLSDGLGAAEAAFAVGYESPSQFGREYRRLFGSSPAQNIAELTSSGG